MNESVNLVDMYEICTGGVVADMCIKRVIISEADLAGEDTIFDKPQRPERCCGRISMFV